MKTTYVPAFTRVNYHIQMPAEGIEKYTPEELRDLAYETATGVQVHIGYLYNTYKEAAKAYGDLYGYITPGVDESGNPVFDVIAPAYEKVYGELNEWNILMACEDMPRERITECHAADYRPSMYQHSHCWTVTVNNEFLLMVKGMLVTAMNIAEETLQTNKSVEQDGMIVITDLAGKEVAQRTWKKGISKISEHITSVTALTNSDVAWHIVSATA